MDTFRYGIALVLMVVLPPAYLYWLVVHPLVGFWRRLGPAWTFTLLALGSALLMFGVYRIRDPLLTVEFGTQPLLVGLGVACLVASSWLLRQLRQHLTVGIQMGVPELAADGHGGELLTDGIYGRIRHPRYVQGLLGLLGWAFVANYLSLYLMVLLSFPVFTLIIRLEEAELRERFGDAYEAYSRRVPRILPRLGAGGRQG